MKNTLKKYTLALFVITVLGASAQAQSKQAPSKELTSLSGYVIGYDQVTKSGCFFVDKEMVEQGIATGLSGKTNKSCVSPKYGPGAGINLEQVPADADYRDPAEQTLLIFQGYWTAKDGVNTFIVLSFEPFF